MRPFSLETGCPSSNDRWAIGAKGAVDFELKDGARNGAIDGGRAREAAEPLAVC